MEKGEREKERGKKHHIRWEMRKNVPHGTSKDGKGGKKFHMEQTTDTKKPPRGEVALVYFLLLSKSHMIS